MPSKPRMPSFSAMAFSTATWVRKRVTSRKGDIAAAKRGVGRLVRSVRMKATSPAASSESSLVSGSKGTGT